MNVDATEAGHACIVMLMVLRCSLLVAFVALVVVTWGQSIRYEHYIPGSTYSAVRKAAEQDGPPDFPDMKEDERGTLVIASGDFHNLDITITCGKAYPQAKLLSLAQSIARQIGTPNADYIVNTGKRLQYVDIELNKYLRKGQWKSEGTIEIGAVVQMVKDSDLPRPIGVGIEKSKQTGGAYNGQRLEKTLAFDANSVKPDAVFVSQTERHWYGILGVVFMAGMFLIMVVGAPVIVLRLALKPPKETTTEPRSEPEPLSLAGNQEVYAKKKASSWGWLIFPFFMMTSGLLQVPMRDAESWIPFNPPSWAVMLALAPMLTSVLVGKVILSRRRKLQPEQAKQPQDQSFAFMPIVMAPTMTVILLFLALILVRPYWQPPVSPKVMQTIFRCSIGIAAVVTIALMVRQARKGKTVLGPGDPDYDAAIELARNAHVRLRKVEINHNFKGVNAAATLFGRVFVTDGFREKLTLNERRAILAHEIGHQKRNHVPFLLFANLAIFAVLLVVMVRLDAMVEHGPEWLKTLMSGPFIFYIPQTIVSLILLSPIRRKAELSADRFALEQTRDYALVATALARVHLLNGSPHTMTPRDERISSHPSLSKRLDALRAVAREMGLDIDDRGVEAMMQGDNVTVGTAGDEPASPEPRKD